MIRTSCIRAIVLALFLLGLGGVGRAQDLVITHAAVYSAPDAPVRKNMAVVIRHGVIAGVGEHLRIPKGMETISCQGCVCARRFLECACTFHVAEVGRCSSSAGR
jgi:hypothetical protein